MCHRLDTLSSVRLEWPLPSSSPRSSLLRASIALVTVGIIATLITLAISSAGARIDVAGIRMPLFAVAVIATFAIQILVFIPSALKRTERFFDLTGSGTYFVVTALMLLVAENVGVVHVLVTVLVLVWSGRLGSFLFMRVSKAGEDTRFEQIKRDPLRFLSVWIIQGLWVSVTACAAWALLAAPMPVEFTLFTGIGVALWVLGFGIEVIADLQKSAFRSREHNKGRFITSGLWSVSRHPNYFGEFVLWLGIAVIALPTLEGWRYVALISPVFVWILLTRVSGLPQLEKQGMQRWGDDPEYRAYVDSTSVMVPWLGARGPWGTRT